MDAMTEALSNADELITMLQRDHNLDYSKHRDLLANEIWMEGFWEGNWDVTVDFDDPNLRSIRCIQEDEYDQSMDDDDDDDDEDMPSWDKMLTSRPEYTWFADDIH